MLIGQLSKRTGFSRDTIRYYEKIGLLQLPERRWNSPAYKDYPEELVHVLHAIRKYKELGFTLEEIRELLVKQQMGVLNVEKLLQVVELKIAGTNAEIERLHAMKLRLSREHAQLLGRKTGHSIALPEMKLAA